MQGGTKKLWWIWSVAGRPGLGILADGKPEAIPVPGVVPELKGWIIRLQKTRTWQITTTLLQKRRQETLLIASGVLSLRIDFIFGAKYVDGLPELQIMRRVGCESCDTLADLVTSQGWLHIAEGRRTPDGLLASKCISVPISVSLPSVLSSRHVGTVLLKLHLWEAFDR